MNNPTTPNDGGPAFPQEIREDNGRGYGEKHSVFYPGMSLRDYFAGKALEGMLANSRRVFGFIDCAKDAFSFADAMLKAREVKP